MSKVVILGQGYVGLPLAVAAADAGHTTIGFDVDSDRIRQLAAGESYVEDIDSETIRRLLAAGVYLPTSDEADLDGFDVAVISVPTPLREGAPDLTFIESAAREVKAIRFAWAGSGRAPRSSWSRPLIRARRRISSSRCWKRRPGSPPARTSISATARSGSTRATRRTGSRRRPRSWRGSPRRR